MTASLQGLDLPGVVPSGLIEAFAKSHLDLEFHLRETLDEAGSRLAASLHEFLAGLAAERVEKIKEELLFRDLSSTGNRRRDDFEARFQLGLRLIATEIHTLRQRALLDGRPRPRPYEEEDLADVKVDEHGLVSADEFTYLHGAYARGVSVFQPCPSLLSQPNSIYWVDIALNQLRSRAAVRLRLDPLMVAPRDGYMGMAYLMASYGRPLDWNRVLGLRDGEAEHGTWWPDEGRVTDIARSDFVWARHGEEIEFVCEEVPTSEAAALRAARYFHSVFRLPEDAFVHADGALRFYSPGAEVESRHQIHVRDSGRVGARIKLFRVDGCFDLAAWGSLAKSFFLWNDDVAKYFPHDE